MRFTRVKVNEKVVELDWFTKDAAGEKRETTLQSPNRPMPALIKALAAIKPFVVDLLELPEPWEEAMSITTVNLDDGGKDNQRGIIVTAIKKVEKASGRVLVLNTPRMSESAGDDPVDGALDHDTVKLIAKLEIAATAYVNGEREQAELPLSEPDKSVATGEGDQADDLGKRRRRRGQAKFIPGVGPNLGTTDAVIVPEDDALRTLMLAQARDVPLEAIGRWTSSERDMVQRWLADPKQPEPEALVRDATPSMFDDHAAKSDAEWTQDAPPPKADDVEPVVG